MAFDLDILMCLICLRSYCHGMVTTRPTFSKVGEAKVNHFLKS